MPSETDAAVDVRDLTWRPAGRRAPTLRDVCLRVAPGERVLLAGASGAGKSTLLRAIAGVLESNAAGALDGAVRVAGAAVGTIPGAAGMVLQEPGDALVAGTVGRDIAFGPENLALHRPRIWERVHHALQATGFPYGVERPTSALSGGETQRLALAGALALEPSVLLLDEPTSMLDPAAAATVRTAVRDVLDDSGAALLVVDHDIAAWRDDVDRIVVLGDGGQLVADGPAREVLAYRGAELAAQGLWVPGLPTPDPLEVPADAVAPWDRRVDDGTTVLTARDLVVRYRSLLRTSGGAASPAALDGVCADLVAGRVLAITGHSGSGKSTLTGVLAGLDAVESGTVEAAPALADRRGRRTPRAWSSRHLARFFAWVPQAPEIAVVARTVRDDVLAAARAVRRDAATADNRADTLLDVLGLSHLADADPHHLSGGETRRLALAGALAHGPAAVLLDEPTVGQDRNTWAAVTGLVTTARRAGTALGLATHDQLAVETLADATLTLEAGRMMAPQVRT